MSSLGFEVNGGQWTLLERVWVITWAGVQSTTLVLCIQIIWEEARTQWFELRAAHPQHCRATLKPK